MDSEDIILYNNIHKKILKYTQVSLHTKEVVINYIIEYNNLVNSVIKKLNNEINSLRNKINSLTEELNFYKSNTIDKNIYEAEYY